MIHLGDADSLDGLAGTNGRAVRVHLGGRECTCSTSTTRHRGGSYVAMNARYFRSFVIRQAMERAWLSEGAESSELQIEGDSEEEV